MFSNKFERLKNPSAWRRIAVATWKTPNDPTVYGKLPIEFSKALTFLDEINSKSSQKITVTHLVGKALALVLKKYPDLNGIIRWKRIYLRKKVDLFFQVAVEERGPGEKPELSGAIVEACEDKSLGEIAASLKLKSRAIREGDESHFKATFALLKHVPPLLLSWIIRLATFIIYNLGLSFPKLGLPADPFGSAMVTSVGMWHLPPGFAPLVPVSRVPLIVCVGEVRDKPWVIDGQLSVCPILTLTFTFDHRFMDGLTGSRMAHYFRDILENPEKHLA